MLPWLHLCWLQTIMRPQKPPCCDPVSNLAWVHSDLGPRNHQFDGCCIYRVAATMNKIHLNWTCLFTTLTSSTCVPVEQNHNCCCNEVLFFYQTSSFNPPSNAVSYCDCEPLYDVCCPCRQKGWESLKSSAWHTTFYISASHFLSQIYSADHLMKPVIELINPDHTTRVKAQRILNSLWNTSNRPRLPEWTIWQPLFILRRRVCRWQMCAWQRSFQTRRWLNDKYTRTPFQSR